MRIGKFSVLTGITPHTLRFYEREGLIQVQRDGGGRRYYSEKDVEWAKFVQRLKETGMPLKDIRTYAKWRDEGDSTIALRLALLEQHQSYVLQEKQKWEAYLVNLNRKIALYQELLG
ncbi:MerR family transcriptional regulator [Aggregatibacter kilianii]|uniref:MerR family transcriptional regulator n=1 Tax=Aggregatibacter kilianii TaxID=2025884 RepID=UPI000D645783|nr:MerR family transcriptional regulator [Aggregatibacter kilianii]